ncbi:MAG: hypothetical protein J3Q66DRAFT_4561 [Benniella sp.]|nr:MAG: hypothetical protein J3Q66DRAFT_4561 [Benniella sp.]
MEAMNYTARHHRRIAVDPAHHASARTPSNTTAHYAKFMNYQGRSGLESRPSPSHHRHVQDNDADAAIKEARSRLRANENRTPAMVAVKNSSVRRSIRGQDAAVLVVSESRIGGGHHSHIDSDDEIASSLSRFAFPLPPSFQHNDKLLVNNRTKSRRANKKLPSPSSSSSYHSTSTRPTSNYLTPQPQPHPHLPPHNSQHLSPARMATVALAVGSTFVSPLPPTVLPTVGRDRVILPTPSDFSEVQPDGFAEGEVLESEHNDAWEQHSPYQYTQHLNSARCSSTTLYEESRPPSRQNSKDVQSPMKHTQVQSKIDAPSTSTPTWMMGTPSKVEPSTPSRGKNADSGVESSQGSPSLFTPTTPPSTPTPAGLDKAQKNLLLFNRIPRQWPASQETLHHNYIAAANNAPVSLLL